MKKVCVIGHFGGNKICLDGQTIKTKIVTAELKKQLGEEQVGLIDTVGGKKALIRFVFQTFSILKNSENVIMLPAHNGVRFFTPVLTFWNMFFHRKLHYCVIGGWLPDFLRKQKILAKQLKKFHGIYVETTTMEKALAEQGFTNTYVVPNCKELRPIKTEELLDQAGKPYKLCTFSRVNRLKGIEDAAKVIQNINREQNSVVFELDIYGRIDSGEEEWFEHFLRKAPDYIKYCGEIPPDQSVAAIKQYFALLFPTKYFTEGIPGTIIDAYFSGVPVISSRWQSFSDVVEDGVTGVGYEFDSEKALQDLLLKIAENPDEFLKLKPNCLKKAEEFTPEAAVAKILQKIGSAAR